MNRPVRRPKSFDTGRSKENLSQKTVKSLRQESYIFSFYNKINIYSLFFFFSRRPFKINTSQKERFSQNTVTLHFKVIISKTTFTKKVLF